MSEHKMEFAYKTFIFDKKRKVDDTDSFRNYLFNHKGDVLKHFKDVYAVESVFDYGLNHFNQFEHYVIIKEKHSKPIIKAKNNNPEFTLFELIHNVTGLSPEEINVIKDFFFVKAKINNVEQRMYIKEMNILENVSIKNTLVQQFNNLKDEDKQGDVPNLFRAITDYAIQNFIICRKAVDVKDNIHYQTILNPKIAIDKNKENEIMQKLNQLNVILKKVKSKP